MKARIVLLKQAAGLDNTVDSKRLPFNPEEGVAALAAAVNIRFEKGGSIHRRKGYRKVRSEASHSMYSNGPECLFVSEDSLYRLNPDGTRTGLRQNLTPGLRMHYASIGLKTFYSNGLENGYVLHNAPSYVWEKGPYVGPKTHRVISGPPMGTRMCSYHGRLYIAVEDTLFYSEPFAPNYFAHAENYISCGSKITMLRAVADGLWVGTENGLIALSGPDAPEFQFRFESVDSPIPGTSVTLRAENLTWLDNVEGPMVAFATLGGIYLAGKTDGTGFLRNISEQKLKYQINGRSGAAVLDKRGKGLLISIQDREV